MKQVVLIRRARRFSPNSVDNDYAILKEVERELLKNNCQTHWFDEENWQANDFKATRKDLVLTMARSTTLLNSLCEAESEGISVVNSVKGVEACCRSKLFACLKENNISVPTERGEHGYWLKRGDESAQSIGDVVYCKDTHKLEEAMRLFDKRGIKERVVQAHIQGDLLKFYGVAGTGFFSIFYPNDDGMSKFGNENYNGTPHHYHFDTMAFRTEVERISHLTGVDVYGGDAIITEQGGWFFIDFNDWPSFSRCRTEAAEAIACLATSLMENKEKTEE